MDIPNDIKSNVIQICAYFAIRLRDAKEQWEIDHYAELYKHANEIKDWLEQKGV